MDGGSDIAEDWGYFEVEGNGTWVHSGPQEGQEEDTESDPQINPV
jgi:hypothetical protein